MLQRSLTESFEDFFKKNIVDSLINATERYGCSCVSSLYTPPPTCVYASPPLKKELAGLPTFPTIHSLSESRDYIITVTRRPKTQLVFVPSYRDAHMDYVYPQPPYVYPKKEQLAEVCVTRA